MDTIRTRRMCRRYNSIGIEVMLLRHSEASRVHSKSYRRRKAHNPLSLARYQAVHLQVHLEGVQGGGAHLHKKEPTGRRRFGPTNPGT